MKQSYVPDGTMVCCSEGTMPSSLIVTSQLTKKIGGKLAATGLDRFEGNFVCLKMILAGAALGALAAAAMAAAAGAALGGVVVAYAAGSATGRTAGKLAAMIPSLCSMLTKPSMWILPHPTVKVEGKMALMERATLPCLLGGTVGLLMPNHSLAIDLAVLSVDVYENEEDYAKLTQEEKDRLSQYEKVSPKDLQLEPSLFYEENGGFYAQLYKKGDQYVLAFRGTNDGKDVGTDVWQAVGGSSHQYEKAATLASTVQNTLPEGTDVVITGHSLGGGLAELAGGVTGYPVYTFNAAGVHQRTLRKNHIRRKDTAHVYSYHTKEDPLTIAQNNRVVATPVATSVILGVLSIPFGGIPMAAVFSASAWLLATGAVPKAGGKQIEIDTDAIVSGHSMLVLAEALTKEAEVNQKTGPVFARNVA